MEETTEGYYASLYASSQGWYEADHRLLPWWEYSLGVLLLTACRQLDDHVGAIEVLSNVVDWDDQAASFSDVSVVLS